MFHQLRGAAEHVLLLLHLARVLGVLLGSYKKWRLPRRLPIFREQLSLVQNLRPMTMTLSPVFWSQVLPLGRLAAKSFIRSVARNNPGRIGVRYGTTYVLHVLLQLNIPKTLGLLVTKECCVSCVEQKNINNCGLSVREYLDCSWDAVKRGTYQEKFPFLSNPHCNCEIYSKPDS